MPDEPIVEQIALKLKETLEAIEADAGETYWYTPGIVIRCDYFEDAPPDRSFDVIYQLRPDSRTRAQRGTRATYLRTGRWLLTVAAQDRRPTKNFYRQDTTEPIPEVVKSRLLEDVQTAFGAQPWTSWAGLNVHSIVVAAEDLEGAEAAWEGWHLANASIVVEWVERHG